MGFIAEYLVDSLDGFTSEYNVSKVWVGLILLRENFSFLDDLSLILLIAIVGNAAEHVTAVTVAYKDKLDLGRSTLSHPKF